MLRDELRGRELRAVTDTLVPTAGDCVVNDDCCGGLCLGGKCDLPCELTGSACAGAAECCSGICVDGVCATIN